MRTEIITPEVSKDTNPFMQFVPTEITPIVLTPELLAENEAIGLYDAETSTILVERAEFLLYGFVTIGTALEKPAFNFLKKCIADRDFNKSASEDKKKVRHLLCFDTLMQRVEQRPGYARDVTIQKKKALIDDFMNGVKSEEEFKDALEDQIASLFDPELFEVDYRKMSGRAPCVGLGKLMIMGKGESPTESKRLCLACPVFSHCGVINLASPKGIGINAALTIRETTDLKRGVGQKAIMMMLNDPEGGIFRDAVRDMMAEFQELVVLDNVSNASGNQPDESINARSANKKVLVHLQSALRALIVAYATTPKDGSSQEE